MLLGALLLAAGLAAHSAADERAKPVSGGHAGVCGGEQSAAHGGGTGLELVSLCSYMEAIFSFTVLPMQALSLIAIAAAGGHRNGAFAEAEIRCEGGSLS